MNIVMAGIDYTVAKLHVREQFAYSAESKRALQAALKEQPQVRGGLLLATCNRTELYLSLEDGTALDPFALLCQPLPREATLRTLPHRTLEGREAFWHLCQTAVGAQSQIFGEDQIIGQVKRALQEAREARMADGVIEVAFRTAITAAKRAKGQVRIPSPGGSIAHRALEALRARLPQAKRVLVIGSGEVGQLVSALLAERGYEVSMTVRAYRHGAVPLAPGVTHVPYEARYERLPAFDAVVSATLSPHFTLELERYQSLERAPRLLMDLAVPRDIDPDIAQLPGVTLLDVDALGGAQAEQNRQAVLQQLDEVFERHYQDLMRWERRREALTAAEPAARFPLFIEVSGRRALVVGGGRVAARRISTLLGFDLTVEVVAPEVRPEIQELSAAGRLRWQARPFEPADLTGAVLATACTSSREVNHLVGQLARAQGIPVSVADCPEECSFFFPAVAQSEGLVAALVGDGRDHTRVARAARRVQEALARED